MFRVFFCCCLLTCYFAHADAPQWELNDPNKGWSDDDLVLEYFHHSELQRQWTWELIGLHPLKGNEKVLDFGCGDGKITAQLSHSLPNGEIIGVDLSEQMVSFAKRAFPNAYYPSLSFVCSNDVDFACVDIDAAHKFDKIVSSFVFHLVPNPHRILTNLRNWITEGGELMLVTPMGGNKVFFEASVHTFNEFGLELPWKGTHAPESKATMRTLEGVKEIIETTGWEITHFKVKQTPYCFVNREQFIHWMIGTVTANWNIPKSLSLDFFDRLVTHMTEIDPTVVDEKGVYYFGLSRLQVVATPH